MPEEINVTSEAMDSPIQEISIDLLNNKLYEYIYAKQYDDGRKIKIWITADNEDFDIREYYVTFFLKKPDGTFVVRGLEKTYEDGKCYVTLNVTSQMTIFPGKIPFQILVSTSEIIIEEGVIHFDNPESIATVTGYILVEESVVKDGDIESVIDFDVINQLYDAVEEAGSFVSECEANVAAAKDWSETAKSYAVGGTDIPHEGHSDAEDNAKYYCEQASESATDASEWSETAKSYAVGGTDIPHEGHSDAEDNAKYYCEQAADSLSKITLYKIVTLYANQWDSNNQQIVEVIGVQEDESTELIEVIPTNADIEDYVEYGVLCINQGNDTLKFSCKTTPARDLQAYVLVRRIFEGEDGVHAIVIDDELSTTSTNAVQNKVVTNALNHKLDNDHVYQEIPYNNLFEIRGEDQVNRISIIKNLNVIYMSVVLVINSTIGQGSKFLWFKDDISALEAQYGQLKPRYDFDIVGTFGGTTSPIARTYQFLSNTTNPNYGFRNSYGALSVESPQYLRFTAQWVVNENY